MSPSKPARPHEDFRKRLYLQAQKLLDSGLSAMDAAPDDEGIARIVYEVWSRNMGALDAMLCIRGYTFEQRQEFLRVGFLEGKQFALDSHREVCKGCEGSDELQHEIESVN